MASTWASSMSSRSSASSLAMKPMVAKASVTMPASGPKPNIFTNRIATMISGKEREAAMMARQTR